jgi:hypothetical protein
MSGWAASDFVEVKTVTLTIEENTEATFSESALQKIA